MEISIVSENEDWLLHCNRGNHPAVRLRGMDINPNIGEVTQRVLYKNAKDSVEHQLEATYPK